MSKKNSKTSSKNIGRKKSEVGIHHSYTKFLPFSTDSKREKNWAEPKEIDIDGEAFKLMMNAIETVNFHDFRALLSIIYFGQEHPENTKEVEMADKKYIDVYVPKSELYRLMGNYHPQDYFGNGDANNIKYGYFQRLKSYLLYVYKDSADKPCNDGWRPLVDYNSKTDKYSLDKAFYDSCIANGATNLNFQLFGEIESQVAQALYLYLRENRQIIYKGIDVALIAKAIGKKYDSIRNQSDTRASISKALNHLVKKGILKSQNDVGSIITQIQPVMRKNDSGKKEKTYVLYGWKGDNFLTRNNSSLLENNA